MKNTDMNRAAEWAFCSRRGFLSSTAAGILLFTSGAAFADELTRTPMQTEGPFYPDKLPLDTDNDLIIVNDALTPAIGEVTYLSGRVLDTHGNPIRNAMVEIWQVDGKGSYLHTKGANGNNGGQRDNRSELAVEGSCCTSEPGARDASQGGAIDLSVDSRGRNMAVTQQLTNLRQWRAGAKQLGSHRVAQPMCPDLSKTCATGGCGNNFAHPDSGKSFVGCSDADEQGTVCGRCRSASAQISHHCLTDILRTR